MNAVILDHTALLALGAGNRDMSTIIDALHRDQPALIGYTPAMCLAAAAAQRPALADHIGMLDALRIIDLDYPHAAAVGRLIADGAQWAHAHAISSAHPAVDWPTGRPVVTSTPEAYKPWHVVTVEIRT